MMMMMVTVDRIKIVEKLDMIIMRSLCWKWWRFKITKPETPRAIFLHQLFTHDMRPTFFHFLWYDDHDDDDDNISNNDDDDVWQIVIIGERTFLHRVLSTLKSLPRSFGLNHLHIIIIVIIIVVVIFIILINLLTAQEGESPLWIYTLCHQPVISSSRLTFVISHIFILFTAEIFFAEIAVPRSKDWTWRSQESQWCTCATTEPPCHHFYSWKIFS